MEKKRRPRAELRGRSVERLCSVDPVSPQTTLKEYPVTLLNGGRAAKRSGTVRAEGRDE